MCIVATDCGSKLNAAAAAVELGALFDDEGRCGYFAFDVRGAAEYELFAGEDVALDRSIYLRDGYFNYCFSDFCSRADDQRPVR